MGFLDAALPQAQGCTFIVPLRIIERQRALDATITTRAIVKYRLRGVQEGKARVKAGDQLPARAPKSTELLETLTEKTSKLVCEVKRYLSLYRR